MNESLLYQDEKDQECSRILQDKQEFNSRYKEDKLIPSRESRQVIQNFENLSLKQMKHMVYLI